MLQRTGNLDEVAVPEVDQQIASQVVVVLSPLQLNLHHQHITRPSTPPPHNTNTNTNTSRAFLGHHPKTDLEILDGQDRILFLVDVVVEERDQQVSPDHLQLPERLPLPQPPVSHSQRTSPSMFNARQVGAQLARKPAPSVWERHARRRGLVAGHRSKPKGSVLGIREELVRTARAWMLFSVSGEVCC